MPARSAASASKKKAAATSADPTTRRNRHMASGIGAILFFAAWFAIAFIAADKPIPVGFWIALVIIAALTVLVYYRGITYLAWHAAKRANRFWRIMGEGFLAGAVVAIVIWIATAITEPGVPSTLLQRLIWIVILGVLGVLNALLIAGADTALFALLSRKRDGRAA